MIILFFHHLPICNSSVYYSRLCDAENAHAPPTCYLSRNVHEFQKDLTIGKFDATLDAACRGQLHKSRRCTFLVEVEQNIDGDVFLSRGVRTRKPVSVPRQVQDVGRLLMYGNRWLDPVKTNFIYTRKENESG